MSSPVLIEKALIKAREAFARNVTRSVDFRIRQLKQLRACIDDNYDQFLGALREDFRKPKFESVITELEFVKNDIKYQLDHIHQYVKPQRVARPAANILDDAYIKWDPLGVVLIFSAWNYPVQLMLAPLAGAIAAGNCVVIKPSEVAGSTANVMASLLPKYLDKECYPVVTGGADVANQLLQERFDLVFFTGSPNIGKLVYQAASKHMTPVVLELGGKSPLYIDDSVEGQLEVAAKRVLWGKLTNSGQTCVAPDYVLCSPSVQDRFVEASKKVLKDFYGDPAKSDSFARIVNDRNFDRLEKLLSATKGKVVVGGQTAKGERYIAPTLVANVTGNDSLMSEELFGPILPIVPVKSEEEAIQFINRGEKPLAMYIFSNKQPTVNKFLDQTSCGSVCVNDTLMQMVLHSLPFGGIGNSGIGKYHGTYSFETFSHSKSVLAKDYNPLIEYFASSRYPPYTDGKMKLLKVLAGPTPLDGLNYSQIFTVLGSFVVGIISTYVYSAL
nr:unnamed protein product [Mus musculus]